MGAVAWGQATTSSTNAMSQMPTPVAHDNHQSHDTVTNEIVDPSGSLATNRIPEITNTPTPMPTPLTASPKTPLPN
jgi:hypothetical protein